MNTSRHHADWLSLVEVSGPFVSLPVLLRAFPQGLDARDPVQAKALRFSYEEWQRNPSAPGRQRAWMLHVLTNLLGYPADLITEGQNLPPGLEANVAQMGETLRPDFALVSPKNTETAGQAHLLISTYPLNQSLDKPVAERHWKANPATRMMELLHASGVPLGLVTNGEQWMLIFAPRGETTGYASWYSAIWLDEPITLRSFHSLLGIRRFFGVDAANTLLGLLNASAQDQQEVTDQLGYQVREAVHVLVQAFDILDRDAVRTLLKGLAETDLYNAALTVMMRLVFLFSAEERGLLQLGKPLYDDNYAVSTLMEQLQEVADLYGPQVLERRCDAWARLLATFRAVHGGVNHQDLLMPAYGGSLFDPDRYPFLEGRPAGTKWANSSAELLAVNNRVVLHLLSSLQRLRMKVPGGGPSESRRISFRALGVEQIGHVYEGLLDHTAVRATEPVLGIKGTRDKEAEVPLAKLEAILAKGRDALAEFLHDETGRSEKAIVRALDEGMLNEEHRLLIACGHDGGLLQRVRTFAGLIREDSFERPVIVLPGSVYVTGSTTRRSTGTHYTPPSLTEPIVQYTLEPLVYSGPAEGLQKEQWQLNSPKEILDLKVCDMAMGSGAFLVQACRYLSERLTESWENEEKKHPNEILVTPEGGFSQGAPSERLLPNDAAERLAIARRIVADRCLYGVDINPMAVEMAKLSMWLVTLDAKRPFTFLDHAFKCGDSLLGLTSFRQLEQFSLRPEGVKQVAFSTLNLWRHVDEAKRKRELLETMPSDTPEQVAAKVALNIEADEAVVKLRAAGDVLVATELRGLHGKSYERALESAADHMMTRWALGKEYLLNFARAQLEGQKPLHWPLAFPEVLQRGGFSAFIGNPPFRGGSRISTDLGENYRKLLVNSLTPDYIGRVDLCCYFLIAASLRLKTPGCLGYVVTSSVAEGHNAECLSRWLIGRGTQYYWVLSKQDWPGTAKVSVSLVIAANGPYSGNKRIDGQNVAAISGNFKAAVRFERKTIRTSVGLCFRGIELRGDGFILSAAQAEKLILQDERNREILKPYLNGTELNRNAAAVPTSQVIDFNQMNREAASQYRRAFEIVTDTVKPVREAIRGSLHEKDYWKFYDKREAQFKSLLHFPRLLVKSRDSVAWAFGFVPPYYVIGSKIVVFKLSGWEAFGILQSSAHRIWCDEGGSTIGKASTYNPTHGLETFVFPDTFSGKRDLVSAQQFYELRHTIMGATRCSLTEVHNKIESVSDVSNEAVSLRRALTQLDADVMEQYGWLDLAIEFRENLHPELGGYRDHLRRSGLDGEILSRLERLNATWSSREHDIANAEKASLPKISKRIARGGSSEGQLEMKI